MKPLVEETETHVLVGLLLLFFLFLLLLGGGGATGRSTTGSGTTTTTAARRNGSELLGTSSDQLYKELVSLLAMLGSLTIERRAYLVDVLALELLEEGVEAIVISLDADGLEDLLDIVSIRGGVASEAEKKIGCKVLHCDW